MRHTTVLTLMMEALAEYICTSLRYINCCNERECDFREMDIIERKRRQRVSYRRRESLKA
ncbi:hypothetical protein M758_UG050200 [Ceratodon purpureus]|nr:hypothetical protein M758_UG050200 [Ceratodon purpureus]